MEPKYFKKVLDHGEVAIINWMGSDDTIAEAARVSYKKGTNKTSNNAQLIRYLMRHKHTSPFEMAQIQLYIKAPIFVMRQWMRHRTWSYNEVSGRYSEMICQSYVPDVELMTTQDQKNRQARTESTIPAAAEIHDKLAESQQKLYNDYQYCLNNGLARELSRINLPLALYTEVVASVDLHNLLHFLSLRLTEHAQYEIRVYAEAIAEMLVEIFPAVMQAWNDCERGKLVLTQQMAENLAELFKFVTKNISSEQKSELNDKINAFAWTSKSEQADFANIVGHLLL
ncbi:MAG: FAD-dependent thymidylate synthase [Negativicutes bacterium]|jgi:thymidylate synthase (FAD)